MPPKRTLLDLITGGKYKTSQDIPPLIEGPRMSKLEMSEALSGLDRFLNPPLPENVQAPGLGLLEYVESGPVMGLKAMGSLMTGKKGILDLIKRLGGESDKLMLKYKKAKKLGHNTEKIERQLWGNENISMELREKVLPFSEGYETRRHIKGLKK